MTEPREIAAAFAELARTPLAAAGACPNLSRLLRYCWDLTDAEADPAEANGAAPDALASELAAAEHAHLARALADTVAATIATARGLAAETARADQLQAALDSRIVIEQAKGVIAEREHISPDEAFTVLRARSRTTNRKLRDIAAEVVAGTRPPGA